MEGSVVRVDRPHALRALRSEDDVGCPGADGLLDGETGHMVVVEEIVEFIAVQFVESQPLIIRITHVYLTHFSIAGSGSRVGTETDARPLISCHVISARFFGEQDRSGGLHHDRRLVTGRAKQACELLEVLIPVHSHALGDRGQFVTILSHVYLVVHAPFGAGAVHGIRSSRKDILNVRGSIPTTIVPPVSGTPYNWRRVIRVQNSIHVRPAKMAAGNVEVDVTIP